MKKHLIIKKYWKKAVDFEVKWSIARIVTIIFLSQVINGLKTKQEGLKIEIEIQKAKVSVLTLENQNLKENVVFNYLDFEDSPLETWSKKVVRQKGKLRFVGNYFNVAYEKMWGHYFDNDRNNLIGKNNFQLGYPKDVAWNYWRNDSLIYEMLRQNKDTTILKRIEHAKDKNGLVKYFDVIKYPKTRRKDTLIVGKIIKYYD